MARPAGTLWSLEQRMETLQPIEQGWRLRSLLRHACRDEFVRAPDPDVRLDDRARACVGRRSKGGQEGEALGRSRGGFTTKNPVKSAASGDIIAFALTGGVASDVRHFNVLLTSAPTFGRPPSSATKATRWCL